MSYNEPPPTGAEPPNYGAQPPGYGAPPPPPPGYGGPGYGGAPQGTNKKAIWALVLGILGLLCCGFITGIPALILGNSAKKEIDAGNGSGRGLAQAGFILGIISIVLTVLSIILIAAGVINVDGSVQTS